MNTQPFAQRRCNLRCSTPDVAASARIYFGMLATLAMLASVIATPVARAEIVQFQANDGAWGDLRNWSVGRVPGVNDHVVIPVGATCRIAAPAECRSFDVQNSGVLRVEAGASLTLHADSLLVVGTLQLAGSADAPAALIIAADLTLSGRATGIDMTHGQIVAAEGLDPILTFVRLQGPGPTPPRIFGDGEIRVRLDNHAWVWATHPERPLVLAGKPKSGTGEWQARGGATLLVRSDVTGSAAWRIVQGDQSRIRIRRALADLSGFVELITGTMIVDRSFCTSGPLVAQVGSLRFRGAETSSIGQTCPPK